MNCPNCKDEMVISDYPLSPQTDETEKVWECLDCGIVLNYSEELEDSEKNY
ncbi:MAG: hypothetical protein ACTSYA_09905 [Candidatus Kariarchaeaceae archaeon]